MRSVYDGRGRDGDLAVFLNAMLYLDLIIISAACILEAYIMYVTDVSFLCLSTLCWYLVVMVCMNMLQAFYIRSSSTELLLLFGLKMLTAISLRSPM